MNVAGGEARAPARAPILVIGVGSELRRDDAAGRRVAESLLERDLPGVEVRSVQQLTPELSAEFDGRAQVVFVDASVEVDEVTVRTLGGAVTPEVAEPGISHHLDPPTLLRLATRLGWAPAAATIVHVPANDLGFGARLSPATAREVRCAAEEIVALVTVPTASGASGPSPHGERPGLA